MSSNDTNVRQYETPTRSHSVSSTLSSLLSRLGIGDVLRSGLRTPPTDDPRRCTTALLFPYDRIRNTYVNAYMAQICASWRQFAVPSKGVKPNTHIEHDKRAKQARIAPPMHILDVERPIQPRIGRAVRAVQTARCRIRVLDVSPRAGDERVEIGRTRVPRGRWDHRKLLCRAFDRLSRKNCKRVAASVS